MAFKPIREENSLAFRIAVIGCTTCSLNQMFFWLERRSPIKQIRNVSPTAGGKNCAVESFPCPHNVQSTASFASQYLSPKYMLQSLLKQHANSIISNQPANQPTHPSMHTGNQNAMPFSVWSSINKLLNTIGLPCYR
jgi:hypothetical protein